MNFDLKVCCNVAERLAESRIIDDKRVGEPIWKIAREPVSYLDGQANVRYDNHLRRNGGSYARKRTARLAVWRTRVSVMNSLNVSDSYLYRTAAQMSPSVCRPLLRHKRRCVVVIGTTTRLLSWQVAPIPGYLQTTSEGALNKYHGFVKHKT